MIGLIPFPAAVGFWACVPDGLAGLSAASGTRQSRNRNQANTQRETSL